MRLGSVAAAVPAFAAPDGSDPPAVARRPRVQVAVGRLQTAAQAAWRVRDRPARIRELKVRGRNSILGRIPSGARAGSYQR